MILPLHLIRKSMNTTDVINYNKTGFNNKKYLELQKSKILERVDLFRSGKLYLEVGGKFLKDPHAARVLPGFDQYNKRQIFHSMRSMLQILFCINSNDIQQNRQLNNKNEKYTESVDQMLEEIKEVLVVIPTVVVNLCDRDESPDVTEYIDRKRSEGFSIYRRYKINGYPQNVESVLSEGGYGADDYIETKKNLIIVTGAGSNSGKMSTALGQIYLDQLKGYNSGYAKYETFPIWSLPIGHPVNLAYEAATADIGDYNVLDKYHEEAYGKRSVNYNRDVEAFEIIRMLSNLFLPENNHMREYKSPTDMGINYAGFAIDNDEVICVASLNEIRRRANWFREIVYRGAGKMDWVKKCEQLETQALKYINERGYNQDLEL